MGTGWNQVPSKGHYFQSGSVQYITFCIHHLLSSLYDKSIPSLYFMSLSFWTAYSSQVWLCSHGIYKNYIHIHMQKERKTYHIHSLLNKHLFLIYSTVSPSKTWKWFGWEEKVNMTAKLQSQSEEGLGDDSKTAPSTPEYQQSELAQSFEEVSCAFHWHESFGWVRCSSADESRENTGHQSVQFKRSDRSTKQVLHSSSS